jgi:serine/threonine protein kinase
MSESPRDNAATRPESPFDSDSRRAAFDEDTDAFELMRRLLDEANQGGDALAVLHGYRFLRGLGTGGMGAVGLIEHEETKESLALKVMLPRAAVSTKARDQFQREIQNAKALSEPRPHPHIVPLKGWGCWQDIFFFTMEYCPLGSVSELLERRGGRLSLAEAAPIVLQALDGLDYTHHAELPYVELRDGTIRKGRGLVHRDVKPQNILLAGSEHAHVAKLGDYGLSKAFEFAGLSGKTRTGDIGGSLRCLPRQQLVNYRSAKPEVDVWAMAACLYFMLTGKYPRDLPERASSPVSMVLLIEKTPPVPIHQRGVDVPEKLADLLDDALDDTRDLRFQSVAAFKHELERVL